MTETPKYAWAHWVSHVEPGYITDVIVQWRDEPTVKFIGWYVVCDLSPFRSSNYYLYTKTPINHHLHDWRIKLLVPL